MHVRRRPALSALLPRRTIRLHVTVVYGVLFLLSGAGLLAVTISLSGAWSWSGTAEVPSPAAGRGQTPPAAAPGHVPRSRRARAGASGSLLAGRAAVQASHDRGTLAHDLMVGAGIGLALMSMASGVLGWLVAGRILRPLRAMTAATRQISEDDSTAPVLGDARLLQRLVANLVQNALRYNVPGGRVDIQVAVRGGGPRLTISNTGPVIPADQAGRLLQPFQRLSASRPADDDGLGLGLSVVAAIAKAHRASLVVEPGPGGGLDVEITFPAVASRGGQSGNGAAHASQLSLPYHRGATAARYLTVNAFRAEPAGVTDSPKPERP